MILSPAKLNLSLNVHGLLDNGYHSISSYVFFLDLFDKINIKKSSLNNVLIDGIFKDDLIGNGGDTIISKSISFCQNHCDTSDSFQIRLEKNIPVSGGLGGGSANSASIIRYFLSKQRSRKKKIADKVARLSESLGSDVPACLYSKPAIIEGKGEKITFIEFNDQLDIGVVLINPRVQLSTKKVFNNFVLKKPTRRRKPILTIKTINDIKKILKQGNDLEKPAIEIVPDILNVLNVFKKNNKCLSFGMSGSGATCYGIFNSRKDANNFEKIVIRENSLKDYWIWSGGLLNKKRSLILPL